MDNPNPNPNPEEEQEQDRKAIHDSSFYTPSDPVIPDAFASLLETYSGIPRGPPQLHHVKSLRDTAYRVHHYPCLGMYRFLNLSLSTHPLYQSHVLPLLSQSSARPHQNPAEEDEHPEPEPIFLDLGTCLGQDLRKLLADGAHPPLLYGSDVLPAFISLGYSLFRDSSTFPPSHFLAPADGLADPTSPSPDTNPLARLDGKCAIVHASAVFHLFNYADQLVLARRIVRLLRPRSGSLVLGHQNANRTPGEYPSRRPGHRSETLYRHDGESWRGLWERVGGEMEPVVEFRVESELMEHGGMRGVGREEGGRWRGGRDEGICWMRWEVWWE